MNVYLKSNFNEKILFSNCLPNLVAAADDDDDDLKKGDSVVSLYAVGVGVSKSSFVPFILGLLLPLVPPLPTVISLVASKSQ